MKKFKTVTIEQSVSDTNGAIDLKSELKEKEEEDEFGHIGSSDFEEEDQVLSIENDLAIALDAEAAAQEEITHLKKQIEELK